MPAVIPTTLTRPVLAWQVLVIAGAAVAGLLLLSQAYGFHRDELYFVVAGRHLDWGYVDQPPLTPLLSAAAVALLGTQPLAVRVLPALVVGACILIVALIAREMGGSRRAQWLGALVAAVSGYLVAGHPGTTSTYDVFAWAVVLWLVTRLLRGSDPREWLLVGLVGGIGLQNKHLVLFLAAGIVVGLGLHRRDLLRTPWPWLGSLVALLVWAPNIAWQVANGLPQLEMARNIAAEAGDERASLVPQVLLLTGPLLFPVALAGLWRLWRAPDLRPFRALATAFLAVFLAVFLTGGKGYYLVGAIPPLFAAGAIATDGWLGASRVRAAVFGTATVGSLLAIVLLTLPVLPVETFATTPIPEIYKESGEQVGWPDLVATVEGVVGALPEDRQARTVIVTGNYGEHGALALLGNDVAPVYSGHNSAWSWGPPPNERDSVVLVGSAADWRWLFHDCRVAGSIRNAAGLENEEYGAPVVVCDGMGRPWSEVWPSLRHLD